VATRGEAARQVIGLDTNVLVRYLVADDEAQTRTVRELLASARAAGETVFVSLLVLCETYWVLRSAFGWPRANIIEVLDSLLSVDVFQLDEPEVIRSAVESCRQGKGDFADHLIGHLHQAMGCRHTATFDRALRGAPGFTVL
jgi:predicted nucleic-acid-binding protein